MTNTIGDVRGVNTKSTALNTQGGAGTVKPTSSGGNASPGGTKPPKKPDNPTPMPK